MRIENITYHEQNDYNFCGPALASMALSKFGVNVDQSEIGNAIMKKDGFGQENSFTHDVCGFITRYGVFSKYYNNLPKEKAFQILIENVEKGNPVFVSQRYSTRKDVPHARLVIGLQPDKENLKFLEYHDPKDGPNEKLSKEDFLELWNAENSKLMVSSYEFSIFTDTIPNVDENCINCGGKMLETKINFEKNPSGFQYVNSDTKVTWNGIQCVCEKCHITTAVFGKT